MSSQDAQRNEGVALPLLAGLLIGAGVFFVATQPTNQSSAAIVAPKPHTVPDMPQSVAVIKPATEVTPFRSCREARAAGVAPVYEGDPRYGPWLDGDRDGIGCEPYYGWRH